MIRERTISRLSPISVVKNATPDVRTTIHIATYCNMIIMIVMHAHIQISLSIAYT